MSPDIHASTVEVNSPMDTLRTAILQFHELYSNDLDLVRPAAEAHHIELIQGKITEKATQNAYNLKIPELSDLETLQKAKTVLIECMDRRQVAEVIDEIKPDVAIAMAGGPVQPNIKRLEALVNLVTTLSNKNSNSAFTFIMHDGICGGANHFTNGEAAKARDVSIETEHTFMAKFLDTLLAALKTNGVSEARIKTGFAVVKENKFEKIIMTS